MDAWTAPSRRRLAGVGAAARTAPGPPGVVAHEPPLLGLARDPAVDAAALVTLLEEELAPAGLRRAA